MAYTFRNFDEDSKDAVFYAENGEVDRAMRKLGRACRLRDYNVDEAEEECNLTLRRQPNNSFWEACYDGEV